MNESLISSKVKTHEDLDVWKDALELAAETYRVTMNFPSDEKFGLVSQMRRAEVSIASNIAEGAARQSRKEFLHFLYVASGSTSELLTQAIISQKISIGVHQELIQLHQSAEKLARMLRGLIKSLKSSL
jgi:four helix bundle protein